MSKEGKSKHTVRTLMSTHVCNKVVIISVILWSCVFHASVELKKADAVVCL